MTFAFLFALCAVFGVPALACIGKAHRGVYAAVALAGVLSVVMGVGMQGRIDPRANEDQQRGQAVFNAIGDPLAFLGIGLAIGGTFGLLLYRSPKSTAR